MAFINSERWAGLRESMAHFLNWHDWLILTH